LTVEKRHKRQYGYPSYHCGRVLENCEFVCTDISAVGKVKVVFSHNISSPMTY